MKNINPGSGFWLQGLRHVDNKRSHTRF